MANRSYAERLPYIDLESPDVPCCWHDCEEQAAFVGGLRVGNWVLRAELCETHAPLWQFQSEHAPAAEFPSRIESSGLIGRRWPEPAKGK